MTSILLFLGLLMITAASPPPPRTSFLLDSAERPLVHFSLPDVHNTSTLLLSNDGSTLYVGAKDAVLSLDVSQREDIRLKKKVQWSPTQDEINLCKLKGKNPTVDCPNFVQVLQPLNSTHMYACGSYAYSPHDAYIDTESFSLVHYAGATGRCPFNPFQTNTAITLDGELFTASPTDFRGVKPQLSRFFSKDGRPDVNLDTSMSLLEDPEFVSSSLDSEEKKLYFFFSEVGKEFRFIKKLQIPRVAQICKDDVGGQLTLQKKWTSFAKASLVCQPPGQLPFNILQDVFTLQPPEGSGSSETLFYGVFTSQWSSAPESAVCVFKLEDIRRAFTGTYRTFNALTTQWDRVVDNNYNLGSCGLGTSDSVLTEVKKTFLTNDNVNPAQNHSILLSEKQYSRVAVMRTQAANHKSYTILFLLTESGFLHKVALLDQGPWVIEEIQVFTKPQPVKNIILSSSKGVLYVGTTEGVTAVSVANCSIYQSCSQCVLARDPLCGWSRTRTVCDGVTGSDETLLQNLEDDGMETECQTETKNNVIKDINVSLNQAVRLPCRKPSNLAALTWTSSQHQSLPESLFIQSADGSLMFFATADTLGTYRCKAEEGGYKEVVVSYDVKQIASVMQPRSHNNVPKVEGQPPTSKDEPYEDIMTEEPVTTVAQPQPGHPDVTKNGGDNADVYTTNRKEPTHSNKEMPRLKNNVTLTSRTDTRTSVESKPATHKEKSYHSELVAVSILLVICICILILGSLHVCRQRKTVFKVDPLVSPDDDGGRTNKSMEEDANLELKVHS